MVNDRLMKLDVQMDSANKAFEWNDGRPSPRKSGCTIQRPVSSSGAVPIVEKGA